MPSNAAWADLELVNQPGGLQTLQVQEMDEVVLANVPLVQQCGYYAVPLPGDTVVLVYLGNDLSHPVAIGTDTYTNRPNTAQPGDVVVYHRTSGAQVHLKTDGSIAIEGDVTITGNLTVSGQVSDANGSMQEMRGVYNSHQHGGGATPSPLMT